MTEKIHALTTVEQWNTALEGAADKPLLVFKHSTRCSVSAGAYDELMNFLEDAKGPKFDTAMVLVVEDRPVSNAIEERLSLKHASPQAILIENGKVIWSATHWNITYSSLEEQLSEHCEK
ncbi:bacillithiol system redox-active protein YtxJ [Paenibacillus abyssi]|uniref:General stress protein n=1 Tax=Paenibacillus abyssi TaxID=1340531 RepID=A0A917FWS6_9BACL|nr:bacillithiol system redox-active protein YtxJ [Paenibacillus abyssi]GGG09427.1 general stress protein [Paenibacillus abyssi]